MHTLWRSTSFRALGDSFERSHELLFIFTITWGLLVAGIFGITGFGIESGALIAGITLAGMPSRHEINARLTPLRDFFIIMFFVILGAQMNLGNILELLPLALIFSALILIGNPLILMSIMGPLGYKKKTSLQTGFTVAQISEFSLIVIALGVRIGHVSETILSLSTLVALITIFGSTYLITYSDQIYVFLEKYLDIFERKNVQAETPLSTSPEIILFGAGRIGQEFVHHFNERNLSYLAVDHNPDIIAELSAAGAHAIHADAGSIAFLESLLVEKTRMIIITTPEIETSLTISTALREAQPTCLIIGVAAHHRDAQTLYTAGYDYVITPYALGAHHATEIFGSYGFNKESYAYMRSAHQKHLERFYREPIV
ncbi:MAG: cation:proton antiporter [Candidatus Pacebacteria bacterium]|nr:cation:proton antiporter [Candidatus Paceibacterota bacterium]